MRNGGVDVFRLICAFGIVWFHSGAPGARYAYFALPFFLVLLAMPSRAGPLDRAARLLRPWAVWSAIYAAIRIALALRQGREALSWAEPTMLLYGSLIPLWFLPFAVLAGLALRPLAGRRRLALAAPVIAAFVVALAPRFNLAPFDQWVFGLVPVSAGAAFFAQRGAGRYGAFAALAAAFAVLQVLRPDPDNIVILGGSACAMALFMIPMRATAMTAWAARASFPVYLAHPLVLLICHKIGLQGMTLGLCTVAGALAFAAALDAVGGRAARVLA